ncbi:MAG: heme-binding protein [Bacteriovoracaceae bacterium]|nr:heme-binding protein [Bacteriovoracaceae bacterium]
MIKQNNRAIPLLVSLLFLSSCSLFGVQSEEGPKYKVLFKEGYFEVRKYAAYIVAETTISGNFDDSSSEAFKILAGYIFGKNKGKKKVAMTSPVEVKQSSAKISMTSPVEMSQSGSSFTMRFSMPSEYTLSNLPEPLDNRVIFRKVNSKIVGTHRFTWLSSKKRSDKKARELRQWLSKRSDYQLSDSYSYAGYNPPWTIPFLRRNEIHIELQKNRMSHEK